MTKRILMKNMSMTKKNRNKRRWNNLKDISRINNRMIKWISKKTLDKNKWIRNNNILINPWKHNKII